MRSYCLAIHVKYKKIYACSISYNLSITTRSYSSQKVYTQIDKAKPFDSIPGPKPSLPLVGTGWIYFKWLGRYDLSKLHEANLDKYYRYGSIVKEEYQRGSPMVTIYDPADFEKVFRSQGRCPMRPVSEFIRGHRKADPTRYPNVGLANMLGDEWLAHRNKLAPTFMSMGLAEKQIDGQNLVGDSMVNYVRNSVKRNRSKVVENVQDLFYRFTIESIMQMSINRGLGCFDSYTSEDRMNDGNLLVEAAKTFFNAQHDLYYGPPLWRFYETKSFKRLKTSQDRIHDILSKYVDPSLEMIKKGSSCKEQRVTPERHSSVLETLYKTSSYTDLEIKSTITDFIGGGIFTAANALTMILYHLASNQDVQKKLYEEVKTVLCSTNGEINTNDCNLKESHLDRMKLLKSCIKESFRLTPTVPGIARNLAEDLVLSNYHVPKGTLVFSNFMVTCSLDKYFNEPKKYIPDRWIDVKVRRQEIHPFSMLPFGYGKRVCIGREFANLEMNVAVAKLIARFKIELADEAEKIGMKYAFIVIPEKPVRLKFNPR